MPLDSRTGIRAHQDTALTLLHIRVPRGTSAHQRRCWMLNVVMCKGIWFLAMDSIISNFHLLLRHAEWDATDKLDEAHDEGRPDDVPADDEEAADELKPDLFAIAIDGAAIICHAEGSATLCCGKETRSETADQGADKMSMKDLERIVNMSEDA